MKTKIYTYEVSSAFSRRTIQARNKKEAAMLFLQQVPSAKGEKLTIR